MSAAHIGLIGVQVILAQTNMAKIIVAQITFAHIKTGLAQLVWLQ